MIFLLQSLDVVELATDQSLDRYRTERLKDIVELNIDWNIRSNLRDKSNSYMIQAVPIHPLFHLLKSVWDCKTQILPISQYISGGWLKIGKW